MLEQSYQAIRLNCIVKRKQLSYEAQQDWSKSICMRINELEEFKRAQRIALYRSVNGEVDLDSLWSAPSFSKVFYFPKITQNTLSFFKARVNEDFCLNQFGILEPINHQHQILPHQLDIIVTPLVAFDEHGMRLGMGKGYYDRALSTERPKLLLGVGYEFQKQAFIQPQPWDIQLDGIITEKTIYWSRT